MGWPSGFRASAGLVKDTSNIIAMPEGNVLVLNVLNTVVEDLPGPFGSKRLYQLNNQ